ncbi:MAG: AAA family ATPase, partial [Nitrososphaera sp.]
MLLWSRKGQTEFSASWRIGTPIKWIGFTKVFASTPHICILKFMTQDEALEILKMGHNVFLTGPAGSGKTFVLNKYLEYLRRCGVEAGVTASTGIAATHIGGMTIHSWAGIGIKDDLSSNEFHDLTKKDRLVKRLEKTKVLVIDEVSMLHHFRLDLVDRVLRMFAGNLKPFGGMQVVLVGDFFQLPPVTRAGGTAARFAHESAAWQNMELRTCYLEEQYRQDDERYLRVLNDIRGSRVGESTLVPLRERYRKTISLPVTPTKLHVHNVD